MNIDVQCSFALYRVNDPGSPQQGAWNGLLLAWSLAGRGLLLAESVEELLGRAVAVKLLGVVQHQGFGAAEVYSVGLSSLARVVLMYSHVCARISGHFDLERRSLGHCRASVVR